MNTFISGGPGCLLPNEVKDEIIRDTGDFDLNRLYVLDAFTFKWRAAKSTDRAGRKSTKKKHA